jgi:hypothetical protein
MQQPVFLAQRIASVAASNASLFATNFVMPDPQSIGTMRVFFATGSGSIFSMKISDGTNSAEIDISPGSLVASQGFWTVIPFPNDSHWVSGATIATAGINFKMRDNTSSTATYTILLDYTVAAVI